MVCSIKNEILTTLEEKGLVEQKGPELIRIGTVLDVENAAKLMAMDFARNFGESDIPFMSIGNRIILNDDMIQRIDRIIGAPDSKALDQQALDLAEEGLLGSMRNVMTKLGVSERVVERLTDRNGKPIRGVAAADILNRTIQVVQGNENELTEEVVHFMVIAMAELDDPLYRSMRKRIKEEPEYQEVLAEYSDLDTYNEDDLIDEAITKVIVNRLGTAVKSTTVKPGVEELFESNPELANAVYEALGFKSFDTKGVSLDTKERDGWKWIKLNGKNIGEVKLVKNDRRSKEVGLSIKLNEEYQNKGYGQIVHTLVADWAKNEFGDTLYSDFDNSQAEINTLLALTKKGYAEQIGDYGIQKDGRYSTDVRAFRIKTSDEIATITPQQKQQAQQSYSQYLDTIFPDSKVKDIVYHGYKEGVTNIPDNRKNIGKYFSESKKAAMWFGSTKFLPENRKTEEEPWLWEESNNDATIQNAIINLINPAIESDIFEQKNEYPINDGLITKEGDYNTYVVFKPEQIHILGSKQDIEGFKRFMSSGSKAAVEDRNTRWWNRFLNRIKQLFNMTSDPFKEAAMQMFQQDLSRYSNALNVSTRDTIFRSLGNIQDQIRENLLERHGNLVLDEEVTREMLEGRLDPKTIDIIEGDEGTFVRYRYKGELVTRRVTDRSSVEMFKTFKNLKEYKRVGKRKRSKAARVAGTELHDIAHQVLVHLARSKDYKQHFNVVNLHPSKQFKGLTALKRDSGVGKGFELMEKELRRILDEMVEKKKGKKDRIDLYVELRIYNEKDDTGGTIDVLFVTKEGKGILRDYKFMSPKNGVDYSSGTMQLTLDPFRGKKGEGFANQQAYYKQTLENEYGFGTAGIESARVIPGHLKLEYKDGEFTGKVLELHMGPASDRFLEQFPLADFEKTGDKEIDAQLDALYKEHAKLREATRLSPAQRKAKEIIVEAIKALVVRDADITSMLTEITSALKFAEEKMKITDPKDKAYLTDNQLADLIDTLSLFSDLRAAVNAKYMDLVSKKKITKEQKDKKMEKVNESYQPIKDTISALQDLSVTRIMDKLKDKPYRIAIGDEVYSTPVGGLISADTFLASEYIENEYFKAFQDLLLDARGRAEYNQKKHAEKWMELDSKLEEWAEDKKISVLDAYDMLIDDKVEGKGRKLVTVLNKEFKEKRDELISEALDVDSPGVVGEAAKFMKTYYQIKEGAKEKFLEDRKREESYAEIIYFGKNTKGYTTYMNAWDSRRNVWGSKNNSAWASEESLRYLEVKPEKREEAFSEKYKEILKEDTLLEYYNAWTEQMEDFNRIVQDRPIYQTTVPNILPNTIQAFIRKDAVWSNFANNLLIDHSIEVENEEQVGSSKSKVIPLPFLMPPRDANGEIMTDMISTRLTNVMILFGNAVYEHAAASEVEGEARLIKNFLQTRAKEVIISDDGTFLRKKGVNELEVDKVSANTIERYDRLMDQLLYKVMLSGKGASSGFEVGGRKILWSKIARSAKFAFTVKALTLPLRAATAALASRRIFTSARLKAEENYTKEAFAKAWELAKKDTQKYKAIIRYADVFNIGELVMQERRSRGDWFSKHANASYFFSLLSLADEVGDAREIVGLMYNLGLDEKGNIRRLKDLPEGATNLVDMLEFTKDGNVKEDSLDPMVMFQVRQMFYAERYSLTGTKGRYSTSISQADYLLQLVENLRSFIPGILRAKWGNTRYNRFKQSLDTGLYKAMFKKAGFSSKTKEDIEEDATMLEMLKSNLSSLQGLISTMIRLKNFTVSAEERKRRIEDGTWDMEKDETNYNRRVAWVKREFDLAKMSTNDPNIHNMDLEGFAQHLQGTVRAGVHETRVNLMLFVAALLAAGMKPDREQDGTVRYSYNMFLYMLQRILLETSAFINPYELYKLNRSFIPVLGLLEDAAKITGNTADVLFDLVRYGKDVSPGDRSGWLHYSSGMVPGANTIKWMLEPK